VAESTREVPVQVNGKVRDRVVVPFGADAAAIEAAVLASARIQQLLAGRTPDRVIHAGGGRLVNLVVRD
jgi:leucyl-tRNA synthetase